MVGETAIAIHSVFFYGYLGTLKEPITRTQLLEDDIRQDFNRGIIGG